MDRRSSIKTLMVISAGAALIPSCLQEDKKASSVYKKIKVSKDDENLVAEIGETIIPKTDTTGAKDVSAHLFALMMIDDCYEPEKQAQFEKGLNAFRDVVNKKYNKSFIALTSAEKLQALQAMNDDKNAPEDAVFFYNTVKRLTLQAYTSSEYFLTKVQVYKLVPGKFYGCVPVTKA